MSDVIVTLYAGNGDPQKLLLLANDYLQPDKPARVVGNRVEIALPNACWDLVPKGPLKIALNHGGFSTAFNVQPALGGVWELVGRAYTHVLGLLA
jgi:hypothetical protein